MNQNRLNVLLHVPLFVLLLVLGLLVMSGCTVGEHTRSPGCTPGPPLGPCERQPDENQRPAWFYISPPGT